MSWKWFTLVGLWLTTVSVAGGQERKPVPVRETWAGKVADVRLIRLAPESGVITDPQTWQRLWTGWRLGRAPQVDFSKHVVLIGTAMGPNNVIFRPSIGPAGDVNFTVGSTKVAGPGFGYTMQSIDRAGVNTVNGTALPKPEVAYVKVEMRGTLMTGIAAIGGETTGTMIKAGTIVWELDLGRNRALARRAEALNGKPVIVKGELQRREGVEIRERWIVNVSELTAAE